jgi:hypothetical protein
MIIDLSFLNSDLVISGIFAFLAGMAGMMAYTKIRNAGVKHGYQADEAVVEAVVLEYTRRLRDYDKVIAELRARLDIMEVRSQPYVASPPSRQPQPHVAPVSEPALVTQHATAIEERQENNGTTDYILKLLAERPRTSREVQHAVGRTREHTARLMKKLHDSGLVSRDINSKPFKYAITGSGQERLKEKTEVASEPPSVV